MTTLCIEDASPTLAAAIEAAKERRKALGITPLEHRPVRAPEGIPFYVDAEVNAEHLRLTLEAAGYYVGTKGGHNVVRTNVVVA